MEERKDTIHFAPKHPDVEFSYPVNGRKRVAQLNICIIHIYLCTCNYVYMYIHMHTCIYTCTYIHLYTCAQPMSNLLSNEVVRVPGIVQPVLN